MQGNSADQQTQQDKAGNHGYRACPIFILWNVFVPSLSTHTATASNFIAFNAAECKKATDSAEQAKSVMSAFACGFNLTHFLLTNQTLCYTVGQVGFDSYHPFLKRRRSNLKHIDCPCAHWCRHDQLKEVSPLVAFHQGINEILSAYFLHSPLLFGVSVKFLYSLTAK
jgi:hypothetical protein